MPHKSCGAKADRAPPSGYGLLVLRVQRVARGRATGALPGRLPNSRTSLYTLGKHTVLHASLLSDVSH